MRGDAVARLAPVLHERLPAILVEVRQRFRSGWPHYAEFLDDEHPEVATAARAFLNHLIEAAQHPEATPDLRAPHLALFENIGRIESRAGRDLSALLSAYQTGGRVAWQHVARAALRLGVEPAALAALAEAVFAFIDQLSAASAHGYVREQAESAAQREQRREALVDLLLSGRADSVAVRDAARRADWSLPAEAAVILVDESARLETAWLPVRRADLVGAIVPDPAGPGRRGRLSQALRGVGAVIGPAVPLERLPATVAVARTAARLRRAGLLTGDPVFADEHLAAIVVHADPLLLAALRERALRPLAGQTPASRDRLTDTLRSWLRHLGDARAVATELRVHPQTVRYRLEKLRHIFGPALDSPETRAQLMLALEWGEP